MTPMEQGRMLDAVIPNSELVIVRGATHGVIREEPVISNFVIISWLARNFGFRGAIETPENAAEKIIAPPNEEK